MADSDHGYRHVLGARAAVFLASLVAIMSLATGLANITVGIASGPLASFIPEVVQQTAGFTGTLTGFFMLIAVWELRKSHRVGWYATMVLLPITALQGIVQASVYSYPLVLLSVLTLPILGFHYRRFTRPMTLSTAQIGGILALAGTLAYGTLGTYRLRDDFGNVDTITDAFYYTVVTASTVGYGDIVPLSEQATLYTVSLVILGTASFAVVLGSVLGPAIQTRFSYALGTMKNQQYDLLEDHVLVLGYGELTEPLLEELDDVSEFVVVTENENNAKLLRDRDVKVLVGDPSDEEPLHDVGIEHARAIIVATNNDAEDAFAILTARELNPDVRIVAAATVRDNIDKLRRAGADTVLSPAVIGGRLLVRSAIEGKKTENLIDEHIHDE
jgi:voltage-gated potassium channel